MSEHDSTRNIFRKAFLKNFKPFLRECINCGETYNHETSKTGKFCRVCHNFNLFNKNRNNTVTYKEYLEYLKGKEIRSKEYAIEQKELKEKRDNKNKLLSIGMYSCPRCKIERPIEMKTKGHTICIVCNGYKNHKRNKNGCVKTYELFEDEFMARRSFRHGDKKKCIECLEIKPKDQFKNKGSYCIDCWYGAEQSKVRALRKLMREPFRGRNNNKSFEFAFGYTVNQLKEHLIKQFTDGMTWDCVLNNEIHIDHIIPASAFDHNNDKHVAYCWSLQNLQPLWAKDNLAKADYLSNGDKVQTIRKQPDARQRLDDLLYELYGFEA